MSQQVRSANSIKSLGISDAELRLSRVLSIFCFQIQANSFRGRTVWENMPFQISRRKFRKNYSNPHHLTSDDLES